MPLAKILLLKCYALHAGTFQGNEMMTREKLAFSLLRLMINNDWKFDVSEKDWDTQAVERAFRLADLFLKESEITNV